MAELNYSPRALNTLDRFHRTKYIIYVEGNDDKPFWRTIFRLAGVEDMHLKVAGGRSEIEKLEQLIIEESVSILVARDSDYTNLFAKQADHPRIIYTYGYSIENTLYCSHNIAVAISILSRSGEEDVEKVESWLTALIIKIRPLLVHDVANELFGKGTRVLGDNCSRFLKHSSSIEVSQARIEAYLQSISEQFTPQELQEAESLVDGYSRPQIFLVRGHFLSNLVINFVKQESPTISSMPKDMLYGQMLGQLPAHCKDNEDVVHLEDKIRRIPN